MMEPKETLRTLGIQTVTLRNPRSLRATLRNPTEPIFNKKLKSMLNNSNKYRIGDDDSMSKDLILG